MRRHLHIRVLIGMGLVIPASIANLALARPAGATSDTDNCTKLVGNAATLTATLSGCDQVDTGGSGKISHFLPRGGSIKWANRTTTVFKTTSRGESEPDGAFRCPAGTIEFELKGKVTSSTNRSILTGAPVALEVCSHSNGALTNEPHTVVSFGS